MTGTHGLVARGQTWVRLLDLLVLLVHRVQLVTLALQVRLDLLAQRVQQDRKAQLDLRALLAQQVLLVQPVSRLLSPLAQLNLQAPALVISGSFPKTNHY